MNSTGQNTLRQNMLIILLGQAVIYLGIWIWNEYVASYITIIFPILIFVVLVLALIADLIEPSRIPGWYYFMMIMSIVIPLLIGAVFFYINHGQIGWLKE